MPRTGDNDGFALIEIVMEAISVTGIVTMLAIVGVQSTIAAHHAVDSRVHAHFEALRVDLENLAAHQALHYADEASYAGSAEALRMTTSDGVVLSVRSWPDGWAATATHAALEGDRGCAVYFGSVPAPTSPVTPSSPAQVACSE